MFADHIPAGIAEWMVRYTRVILGAGFALVFVAGVASVSVVFRTADADRMVAHTFDVQQTARQLRSALLGAETGQRGFLLTADIGYLQPFERGTAAISVRFDELTKLAADNPGQQELLRGLKPLIDAKLDELQRTVALMRQGKPDEALAIVKTDLGKGLMDTIRDRLDAFSGVESDLLTQRRAAAEALRHWLLASTILSLVLAMGLVGALSLATQHYVGRLRERTAELEAEATRRREAEATLRQAQKIEAVGQLTGGIAHDFNNLLTIIIGNLDTLRRRLANLPAAGDANQLAATLANPVDRALQGARSAAHLTHRLLAFSRRQALDPVRIDLNHLVAGMSDLLRRTLGETINVETVLAGGLWPSFADANQVENALLNLAVNARDAMPDGGRLTIETANAYLDEAYALRFGDVAPGQYVLLSVTDSGTGIATDVLGKVFEPFFTTKPVGVGSGLGLAMVHGFVKQTGGHVRIYSEVGHGTTVKIYLPRLIGPEQMATAPAPRPAAASPPVHARPQETILVVEDNDGVRDYARTALEDLGYRVIEAADASEALRLLDATPRVDLLFTDVILPGAVNGRALAAKVLEQRAGLPVLFTTGYTRNAIVHHGRLDANVHLLSKPYTEQQLAQKVRELLDGTPIGGTAPSQGTAEAGDNA